MGNEEHMFSQSKLEGTLEDISFDQILSACREHMVTGRVVVSAGSATGEFELRAGVVDAARLGPDRGSDAVTRARELKTGTYTLIQSLPSLDGELLGSRAEASLEDVSLPELMRHCEDNALTCTIAIESKGAAGEIVYKVGEISDVRWNGESDEDRIVDIVRMNTGKVRVSAPPLDLGIDGWPSASDDAPFSLSERGPRLSRGTRPAPVSMSGQSDIKLGPLVATSELLTTPPKQRKQADAGVDDADAATVEAPPVEASAETADETMVRTIADPVTEARARLRRDTTAVIRKPRAETPVPRPGPSWSTFAFGVALAFALGALAIWLLGS